MLNLTYILRNIIFNERKEYLEQLMNEELVDQLIPATQFQKDKTNSGNLNDLKGIRYTTWLLGNDYKNHSMRYLRGVVMQDMCKYIEENALEYQKKLFIFLTASILEIYQAAHCYYESNSIDDLPKHKILEFKAFMIETIRETLINLFDVIHNRHMYMILSGGCLYDSKKLTGALVNLYNTIAQRKLDYYEQFQKIPKQTYQNLAGTIDMGNILHPLDELFDALIPYFEDLKKVQKLVKTYNAFITQISQPEVIFHDVVTFHHETIPEVEVTFHYETLERDKKSGVEESACVIVHSENTISLTPIETIAPIALAFNASAQKFERAAIRIHPSKASDPYAKNLSKLFGNYK